MTVIDNPTRHRFESLVDGRTAQLVYRHLEKRLVLVHTEVPEELRGRGIGGQLVETAVEAAIAGDLEVVPECPFARAWLRKHPKVVARAKIDWSRE